MASSFSDLGIELMSTGENAGTWGDKTNTNLQIVEKAIAGYVEVAVTNGGTKALTITDGTTTESDSVARHAVIKLTGTITGNSIVTVPDSIEKVYIVTNGTSGAYTVQFKTASGTGITFGVSEKTTRLVYSDGTNLVDAGFGGALDIEGRELVLDADGDTTITADTDDQIDIKIAGADDFQFTANTFTAQSGSSIVVPESGLTFGSTAITSTAAELNLLDGVSGLVQADFTKLAGVDSTAAELNIVDGGTSATSTTVADADRVVLNDNGTMVQVAVTDLAAYFDDEITAMPNLTSVGTLTTLTVDNVIVNGTTIGHTSDTDLITLADGVATVAGEISVTTLDIGGTNVTSTAAELNILDGVTSTAAELNIVDGGTSATSTTVADADRVVLNDNGTMVQVAVTDLAAYFDDEITAMPNLTSVGTLTTLTVDDITINGSTISDAGNFTIDCDADINLDANGADINFKDDGTQFGGVSSSSGNLIIKSGTTTALTFSGANVTAAGEVSMTTLDIGGTDVTSTAAEINLIDGGATVGTTAVADGDGILHNDGGTMKVTSAATFKTYFQSGISSAADDISAGDAAVTITTSSGDITIDAAANDSDIIFKGTDDSSDITMLTLDGSDAGSATFNDKVTIGDGKLVLNSTAVTSTAAELNLLDGVSGLVQADLTKLAAVDSTAAELNIVDGGTSATSTTLVDADRFVVNDNGTMVQVAASDLTTYINSNANFASVGKAIAMAIVFG